MGTVASLRGQIVVVDAAPLIYYIEQNSDEAIQHRDVLQAFFSAVDAGEITLVVSVVTLIEVLVLPLRKNLSALVKDYNEILTGSIELASVTIPIALEAAEIRATTNLRVPDALVAATAMTYDALLLSRDSDHYNKVRSDRLIKLSELTV